MANLLKKYRHGLVLLIYSSIYMLVFALLEQRDVRAFHIVHTVFDDYIPFCEYFIIPYLLWFPYMYFTICYFIFFNNDKREYYQLAFNLMFGMTIFLIISYIYPNVQHLRPSDFPRENIFTDAVRWLYQTDTPTNILPSIHVFNSLAIHMSIQSCKKLQNKKILVNSSLILTILIILSTMFLKQHSAIDVFMGTTLAMFGYLVFYLPENHVRSSHKILSSYRRKKYHHF